MFDFLKRGKDRKVAQQLRLFAEFFWLFGIKTHWRLGFDTIMVSNTGDGMFKVLLRSSDPTTDLWVVQQFKDAIGVERVSYDMSLDVSQMLYKALDCSWKPLFVVASTPRPDGSKLYVIYRPEDDGNGLIEDLFDAARRIT